MISKIDLIKKDSLFSGGMILLSRCLKDIENVKGKVLDIGCRYGKFTKSIKYYRPDLKIWGIDIDDNVIRRARGKPGGVKFFTGDAQQLPFKKSSFDGILMIEVLEHIKNPDIALKEVARILKRGGVFNLSVPLENNPLTVYGLFKKVFRINLMKRYGHIQVFNFSDIKKLLSQNGFIITDTAYSQHFFYNMIALTYIFYLDLFNIKIDYGQLSSHIKKKHFPIRIFINFWIRITTLICNLESTLLKNVTGLDVQITAVKK